MTVFSGVALSNLLNNERVISTLILALAGLLLLFHIAPFFFFNPSTHAYLNYGDMPVHYLFVLDLSRDPATLPHTGYLKFFHLVSAFFSTAFGFPAGIAMNAVVLFFVLFFVVFSFKLAEHLTRSRFIACLAVFFSLSVSIHLTLISFSVPLPQIMGMALLLAVLFFFLRKRFFIAGLLLGIYFLTHASWPLAVFLVLLYYLIDSFYAKKIHLKPLFIVGLCAVATTLPYFFAYAYYSGETFSPIFWASTIYKGAPANLIPFFVGAVSLINIPFLFKPIFTIAFVAYAFWYFYGRRSELDKNLVFVFSWFLLVVFGTQMYLLSDFTVPKWYIATANRIPVFLLPPVALLTSIAVERLSKNKRVFAFGVCLLFLAFFARPVIIAEQISLGAQDAIAFLRANVRDENIFCEGTFGGREDALYSEIIIRSGNKYHCLPNLGLGIDKFSGEGKPVVVLVSLKNQEVVELTRSFSKEFALLHSNSEYAVFSFEGKLNISKNNLESVVLGLAAREKKTQALSRQNILSKPVRIKLNNHLDAVCFEAFKSIDLVDCNSSEADFELLARQEVLAEIFREPEFFPALVKIFHYYGKKELSIVPMRGELSMKYNSQATIKSWLNAISPSRKLLFLSGFFEGLFGIGKKSGVLLAKRNIFIKDIGVFLEIEVRQDYVQLSTTLIKPETVDLSLSFGFFSKSFRLVTPIALESYPNIIFGLAFAGITEFPEIALAIFALVAVFLFLLWKVLLEPAEK